jgi:hypothetical protein
MAAPGSTDDKLIKMISGAGHFHGPAIVAASKRTGLSLAIALALVEQESDFRNIFGCDKGSILCHQKVTQDRVQQLIRHVEAGGISNGVGLTQLTTIDFIRLAEAAGGAHKVGPQCRVGFQIVHGLIQRHGEQVGLGGYNGGEGNPQIDYANEVLKRRDKWQTLINRTLS